MKRCVCGKSIHFDTKKCPRCGLHFTTGRFFNKVPEKLTTQIPDWQRECDCVGTFGQEAKTDD